MMQRAFILALLVLALLLEARTASSQGRDTEDYLFTFSGAGTDALFTHTDAADGKESRIVRVITINEGATADLMIQIHRNQGWLFESEDNRPPRTLTPIVRLTRYNHDHYTGAHDSRNNKDWQRVWINSHLQSGDTGYAEKWWGGLTDFNSSNRNTPQTIRLLARQDDDAEDDEYLLIVRATGDAARHKVKGVTLQIMVIDDDASVDTLSVQQSPGDGDAGEPEGPVEAPVVANDSPPEDSDAGEPVSPVEVSVSEAQTLVTIGGPTGQMAFRVGLNRVVQAADGAVSVSYTTRAESAQAGLHYTETAGQLVFAVGEEHKRVDVPVLTAVPEAGLKTLRLVATAAVNATLVKSEGVGYIDYADPPPVAANSGSGGRSGGSSLTSAPTPVRAPAPTPTPTRGVLENPGPRSSQSGIGLISGWVCEAEQVEVRLNGQAQAAAYGMARTDTAADCGDTANGFGLLFNWNLLGDGAHTVVALADGEEFGRATITVTTLGEEFVEDAAGTCEVTDFPETGKRVSLVWQEAQQNFVIAEGSRPAGAVQAGAAGVGSLENPSPNSFQSGIGLISGWVCEAERVEVRLNGQAQAAAYGMARTDTAAVCGDTANGFGLLFNWNLLGDGEHDVVAVADGVAFGQARVRVTTLGAEFVEDVAGSCTVEEFPSPGEAVTLDWQEAQQNFVITAIR